VSSKSLILQDGALLMTSEHGYWDLPGGGIEHSETPIEALKREIKEELGVSVSHIDSIPLRTWTLYDKEYDWPLLFLVYATRLHSPPRSNTQELLVDSDARFFKESELASIDLAPYLATVRPELVELINISKTERLK